MVDPASRSEVVLQGGRANAGEVVRIGDQVARPAYPQSDTVADFLGHLRSHRIDYVPRALGFDEQGRQRFDFLVGRVPMPPFPAWAFDEHLLIEVAHHQRQLHRAASRYSPRDDAVWAVSAGDYFPAAATASAELVVCHNDLGMSNTVVAADGPRVVGFIDFDYCRPVDPLFDIAVAARHWVPFGALDMGTGIELDRVRRFGTFCDVHGLDSAQRQRVVDLAIAFLDKARDNIRTLAAQGRAGFQSLLDAGYEQTNRSTVTWLHHHREALAAIG